MNTRTKVGRTRKAKTKTVEISFHSDNATGSDAHPAINVKRYSLPQLDVPEPIAERAYNATVETFWRDAWMIAQQHGYSGVFSEGRSSGWCVPFYQYAHGKLQQLSDWTGQGPDKGYPNYPDVSDASERRRFVKFRAAILELLEDAGAIYKEYAEEFTVRCPNCKEPVWDLAVASKLNKCWNCKLAFD